MVRGSVLALGLLVGLLAGCGQANVQATQTRTMELAQFATVTAPTATLPKATNTPQAQTATTISATVPLTATPPLPTPTPPVLTATPIPPTLTATPLPPAPTVGYTSAHAQFFAQQSREYGRKPLALDVTGDGAPEYFYGSWDCVSCAIRWVTVFQGGEVIFDDAGYLLPSVEGLPDGQGFVITEVVVLPGETLDTASGRVLWTFRYDGSRFSVVNKQETRVAVANAPPTVPPPSSGSVQNQPTLVPISPAATEFKQQIRVSLPQLVTVLQEVERVCPRASALICTSTYNRAKQESLTASRTVLLAPRPDSCNQLYSQVLDLLRRGREVLEGPASAGQGNTSVPGNEAAKRAAAARLLVQEAQALTEDYRGSCR